MALLACLDCGTRFAVGLPRCPHCRSEAYAADDGGQAGTEAAPLGTEAAPAVISESLITGDVPVTPEPAPDGY
jgi:hypothetical protein